MAIVCDYCDRESGVQLCGCGLHACSSCWDDKADQCFDCSDRDDSDEPEDEEVEP